MIDTSLPSDYSIRLRCLKIPTLEEVGNLRRFKKSLEELKTLQIENDAIRLERQRLKVRLRRIA